jgi:TatD DNase family protein
MHCFTGTPEQVREALDLGFFISFAGVVTYPKAKDVQEAAKLVPLDRLLVETDAPYLAPVPHRGRRNEPAYVVHTVKYLAGLRDEDAAVLEAATTANFHRLFTLSYTEGFE